MVIKITKKRAVESPEPAPVAEGALPATIEETPAQRKQRWEDIPHPKAKPIACGFCKHLYLKPCVGEEHARCGNFLYLQQRTAGGKEKTDVDTQGS
jgi:hypothetical protein